MNELILAVVFLVFILIREWQHKNEVELLSKAVIAKNIYELKDSETKNESKEETEKSNLIPEDEVSDEIFMGAIRKQLNKETPQDKFKEKIKSLWPKK